MGKKKEVTVEQETEDELKRINSLLKRATATKDKRMRNPNQEEIDRKIAAYETALAKIDQSNLKELEQVRTLLPAQNYADTMTLMNQTQALKTFQLNIKQIKSLTPVLRLNPVDSTYAPMKLYKVTELAVLVQNTHGDWGGLYAQKLEKKRKARDRDAEDDGDGGGGDGGDGGGAGPGVPSPVRRSAPRARRPTGKATSTHGGVVTTGDE